MAEPGCRAAIELIAVVALLASPFIALVPAMAPVVRPDGSSLGLTTAMLVTAQGIGAVAGALALAGLAERFGRLTVLRTALFSCRCSCAPTPLAPTLAVAGARLRGGRRRLHRRAVRAQHRGPAPGPG